jgi:hypothetical protein
MDTTETTQQKTDRFTSAMVSAGIIAGMVAAIEPDVRDMLADVRTMHSAGAILDPTMYRDFLHDGNRQRNVELLGAVAAFAADLRKRGVIGG